MLPKCFEYLPSVTLWGIIHHHNFDKQIFHQRFEAKGPTFIDVALITKLIAIELALNPVQNLFPVASGAVLHKLFKHVQKSKFSNVVVSYVVKIQKANNDHEFLVQNICKGNTLYGDCTGFILFYFVLNHSHHRLLFIEIISFTHQCRLKF